MGQLNEICFTPAEFARLARIDKSTVPTLESIGLLEITRVKVGNVDRKMITFEAVQNYFRALRGFDIEEAKAAFSNDTAGDRTDHLADEPNEGSDGAVATATEKTQSGAVAAGPQTPVEILEMDEARRREL